MHKSIQRILDSTPKPDPYRDRWDIPERVWGNAVCEDCEYRCKSFSSDFGREEWCGLGDQDYDHPAFCPGFEDEVEND